MTTNPPSAIQANAEFLVDEMNWLSAVLDLRFKIYFQQERSHESIREIEPPDLSKSDSIYAEILGHYNVTFEERIVLTLALAPHVYPQILDIFFTKNERYSRGFTEFGGLKGNNHSGFIPTGETAAFVLSANDLSKRFKILQLFDPDHYFARHKIITLEKDKTSEPILSGAISLSREYLYYFTSGTNYKPTFSHEFPAKRLYTKLDWEDLILDDHIREEINEILSWLKNGETILKDWGLEKLIKPGFRTLFYGPPGTGKTLTASLMGKVTGLEVYRVDLSRVVSKYIGETEKNLANIFDQAENKSWILFFDEADALFGKRTATKDSKDRHANQEVAYLLQRIEDFEGLIVLATNLKSNMDEAFARRFQSMIYFPVPKVSQRFALWKSAFKNCKLDDSVSLKKIASDYEISGGAIINVLRYCALVAVERNDQLIYHEDIRTGIRKELRKEGKTI